MSLSVKQKSFKSIYFCYFLFFNRKSVILQFLSHPSRTSQSTGTSFLYYTANSHQLSALHIVMQVFQCYSLNSSHTFLPLLCSQVHFLCLHLYSCPANRFISSIFLDTICLHQYTIFDFLFVTYFTLYNRLQVHPPHFN